MSQALCSVRTMQTNDVAGESAYQLAKAIAQFRVAPSDDGMVHASVRLDPELGIPLQRAIMRTEAELLLEDADALSLENSRELRTPDQRRADALIELMKNISID